MPKPPFKFRKAALKHRATPEQLDQLIRITSPQSWIVLVAVCLFVIAVVLWGFFGMIPTRVEGKGLLLAEKGNIYAAVAPEGSGRIVKVAVQPGDKVKKGQVVAVLKRPDLIKEVMVTRSYIKHLREKYNTLSQTAKKEIVQQKKHIAAQNIVLKRLIDSERKNLAEIEKLLKIRREAHKRGLDPYHRVVETLNQYYNSKAEIEQSNNRLTQNKIDEANFIDKWEQRLRDLDLKMKDEEHKLNTLQEKLTLSKQVVSPIDGQVTAVQKTVGDVVKGGDFVVSIATSGNGLDAIVYLPPEKGKRVKPGMEALVSPVTVEKEEYGSLKGKVLTVSPFPVSQQAMMAVFHNEDLVKHLMQDSAPIAARIRIQKDSTTPSGYAWTSSQGPDQDITPGTLVEANITVRKQAPVTLIIPMFKKLLNLE